MYKGRRKVEGGTAVSRRRAGRKRAGSGRIAAVRPTWLPVAAADAAAAPFVWLFSLQKTVEYVAIKSVPRDQKQSVLKEVGSTGVLTWLAGGQ